MKRTVPTLHLTDRDFDVLVALGDYRFLTADQLAVLYFPSADAAQRRLRDLVVAELVLRVFTPVRPYDPKATIVYALSGKGSRLAATKLDGKRPSYLTEHERRGGLCIDHTLRRNDVRLTLAELGRTVPQFRFGVWKQAKDDVKATTTIERRGYRDRVTLVPDGVAELLVHGRREVLAIEVDMGSVHLKSMFSRYRGYFEHWKSGGAYAKYGTSAYRVLTLVNSERRMQALMGCARDSPGRGRGSRLFWFGLLEHANPRTPTKLLDAVLSVATARPSPPTRLFLDMNTPNNPSLCSTESSTSSSGTSSASPNDVSSANT